MSPNPVITSAFRVGRCSSPARAPASAPRSPFAPHRKAPGSGCTTATPKTVR